jgi:hypothetical protein
LVGEVINHRTTGAAHAPLTSLSLSK